jgi:glutathione S-transferase
MPYWETEEFNRGRRLETSIDDQKIVDSEIRAAEEQIKRLENYIERLKAQGKYAMGLKFEVAKIYRNSGRIAVNEKLKAGDLICSDGRRARR